MVCRFRRWRELLTLAFICLVLLMAPGAYAGSGHGDMSMRPFPDPTPAANDNSILHDVAGITLHASAAYGGTYRTGSWVPIHITVQNDSADLLAEVRVTARSSANFAAALDLPNGARKSVTVYAFVPGFTRRMTIQLIRGAAPSTDPALTLAQQQVTLDPQSGDTQMVAVIAGEGASLRLPNRLTNNTRVVSVPLSLGEVPDRALGLAMFDTLVLNDVPTRELSAAQQATIHEWVLRGGQLIIAGGAGAQRTLDGLPEALRPVRVTGTQQIDASSILDTLDTDRGALTLAQVEPLAGASGSPDTYVPPVRGLNSAAYPSLLVERSVGKGAVSFFAVSFTAAALSGWQGEELLWSDLVHPRQNIPAGFGPNNTSLDMFVEGNVATTLTRLPGLELPSLLTLGMLLLAYIVLVGPTTYVVLRLLDRQVLGWVIVPIFTIIFALLAYGMGYAQRGGDVVLNQVTLVEPLTPARDTNSFARVRSFIGIFSPSRNSYTLETSGTPLLRPISLQGPWGAPGETGQSGLFLQGQSAPLAPGARATNLEVAQWSMRAVLADEVQAYQGIAAQVVLDGSALKGEITNHSTQMLHDVVLVQGNRVARVGNLAPGEGRSTELTLSNPPTAMGGMPEGSMPLGYLIYGEQMERSNIPGATPLPPAVQLRSEILDTLYSYGPIPRSSRPILLAWSDHTPLDVNVPDRRIARQQITLITFAPPLRVAGEQLTLEPGWMERQVEAPAENLCMGSNGMGFTLFGQPVITTLRLPRELAGIQLQEMTLIPTSDGVWPAEVRMEVFDWSTGEWVEQPAGARDVRVAQPQRFLNSSGEVRVRLSIELAPQNAPGCMYVDATLTGTMP